MQQYCFRCAVQPQLQSQGAEPLALPRSQLGPMLPRRAAPVERPSLWPPILRSGCVTGSCHCQRPRASGSLRARQWHANCLLARPTCTCARTSSYALRVGIVTTLRPLARHCHAHLLARSRIRSAAMLRPQRRCREAARNCTPAHILGSHLSRTTSLASSNFKADDILVHHRGAPSRWRWPRPR